MRSVRSEVKCPGLTMELDTKMTDYSIVEWGCISSGGLHSGGDWSTDGGSADLVSQAELLREAKQKTASEIPL